MPAERPTVDPPPAPSAARALAALTRQLRALRSLVRSLEDRHYAESRDAFLDASIGAHVRHALDHVESLGKCAGSGVLDYDQRHRGTDVERDRAAGVRAIDRAVEILEAVDPGGAEDDLELRVLVDPRGDTVTTRSTLTREIVFTLSHTIHHAAIISAMARLSGASVPEDFGLAPSTIRHRGAASEGPPTDDSSCAR